MAQVVSARTPCRWRAVPPRLSPTWGHAWQLLNVWGQRAGQALQAVVQQLHSRGRVRHEEG